MQTRTEAERFYLTTNQLAELSDMPTSAIANLRREGNLRPLGGTGLRTWSILDAAVLRAARELKERAKVPYRTTVHALDQVRAGHLFAAHGHRLLGIAGVRGRRSWIVLQASEGDAMELLLESDLGREENDVRLIELGTWVVDALRGVLEAERDRRMTAGRK